MRVNVLSGGTARVLSLLSLPDRGHAALCLPNASRAIPRSHLASTTFKGGATARARGVRNCSGSNTNSGFVGARKRKLIEPGPEWDSRCAWSEGHVVDSTMGVRNRKTHGTANRVPSRRALRLTQLEGVHGSVPANMVWKQILHGPTCELPLTTRQDIPWHLGSPTLSRSKWPPLAIARRSWAMRQSMKPSRLRGPFVVLNANPNLPTALATSSRPGAAFYSGKAAQHGIHSS